MIVRKSRAVEDKKDRQYKEEVEEEFLSFLLLYACMHFVCSLYAFPYAYIYALSALRTRLFAFLYALYAVNSGVVFSHSMHSRFFDAYNAYNLSELFTSATVFGHIAKPMRIINGQVFVPGMPGVRRRVKKCVKDLEKNPRAQDVLPRMDFTPRQARCLLRDFYFGRHGKWNADYMDLARLTSIARGKVDPIAHRSAIPACVPVCDERFIWDWRIPARWYRRHDAYNPSDR